MSRTKILGIAAITTLIVAVGNPADANTVPAKKDCNVYRASIIFKKIKDGSTYTFSDGTTAKCNNGAWVTVKQGSSGGQSNAKSPKTAAQQACSLTHQYANRGFPTSYIDESVDLLRAVADRFYAGGLMDAGTAIIYEVIPALYGGFYGQLQVRPLLAQIYNRSC
jgi:hypothetical protein